MPTLTWGLVEKHEVDRQDTGHRKGLWEADECRNQDIKGSPEAPHQAYTVECTPVLRAHFPVQAPPRGIIADLMQNPHDRKPTLEILSQVMGYIRLPTVVPSLRTPQNIRKGTPSQASLSG